MSDTDQLSPELEELRESLDGLATADRPLLDSITARGRARRRRRRSMIAQGATALVVAVVAVVLGVTATSGSPTSLSTIRTASFTLTRHTDGTDRLTLNPGELLNSSQLQSDLAKEGIPAKVTSGSYCTSDPAPGGFSKVVSQPGEGTGEGTFKAGSGPQPTITIDGSALASGTELSIGTFQLPGGVQQADVGIISKDSNSCSTTPPSLGPDTAGFGLSYRGSAP